MLPSPVFLLPKGFFSSPVHPTRGFCGLGLPGDFWVVDKQKQSSVTTAGECTGWSVPGFCSFKVCCRLVSHDVLIPWMCLEPSAMAGEGGALDSARTQTISHVPHLAPRFVEWGRSEHALSPLGSMQCAHLIVPYERAPVWLEMSGVRHWLLV